MNTYMKRRWTARRIEAVESLGGQCVRCGATERLEFDHIDPATKVNSIAQMSSASEAKFWAEVKKCQLLCKPCHITKTNENQENIR